MKITKVLNPQHAYSLLVLTDVFTLRIFQWTFLYSQFTLFMLSNPSVIITAPGKAYVSPQR